MKFESQMPRGALLPVHADQGGVLQLRGQQDHGPVRQGEVDEAAQMQGEVRQPARLPSRGEGVAQLSLWRMPSVQAGGRAFQINFILYTLKLITTFQINTNNLNIF